MYQVTFNIGMEIVSVLKVVFCFMFADSSTKEGWNCTTDWRCSACKVVAPRQACLCRNGQDSGGRHRRSPGNVLKEDVLLSPIKMCHVWICCFLFEVAPIWYLWHFSHEWFSEIVVSQAHLEVPSVCFAQWNQIWKQCIVFYLEALLIEWTIWHSWQKGYFPKSSHQQMYRSSLLVGVQEVIDMCDYAVGLSRQLNGSILPSEREQANPHSNCDQGLNVTSLC